MIEERASPTWILSIVLAATLSCVSHLNAQGSAVPATVDGIRISESDIDVRYRNRLRKLQSDEFALTREAVSHAVDKYLIQRAAEEEGITVEQYEADHIDRSVPPITDAEALAVIDSDPGRQNSPPKGVALENVKSHLFEVRRAQVRSEVVRKLRTAAAIQWAGTPPTFDIDASGLPHKGSPDAAITVLEVGDFECPYCARMNPVLERLEREHQGDVQLVFLNYPLSIHHSAVQAAEAAKCADEQGMYWKMQDILFAAKYPLDVMAVAASAASIGIDTKRFGDCMGAHKFLQQVLEEKE